MSRPALGFLQHVQWVAVSLVVKRPGRKADYSHLLPNVRINGSVPPYIHTMSWHAAGRLLLYCLGYKFVIIRGFLLLLLLSERSLVELMVNETHLSRCVVLRTYIGEECGSNLYRDFQYPGECLPWFSAGYFGQMHCSLSSMRSTLSNSSYCNVY